MISRVDFFLGEFHDKNFVKEKSEVTVLKSLKAGKAFFILSQVQSVCIPDT